MSEMAVRICKRIIKKCDDHALGMLEYSNTPLTGMEYSPCQLLMNRSTRTKLPIHEKLLHPSIPHNAHEQMTQLKLKQKEYYDRSSKTLPEIFPNEIVRIHKPSTPNIWSKALVKEKSEHPNSYIVTTENGKSYRRNHRDLLKTNEQEYLVNHPVDEHIDFNILSSSNIPTDDANIARHRLLKMNSIFTSTYGPSTSTLIRLYKSYIRSLFDYGAPATCVASPHVQRIW